MRGHPAISPDHGFRRGERIENGFFGRLHRSLEQAVHGAGIDHLDLMH